MRGHTNNGINSKPRPPVLIDYLEMLLRILVKGTIPFKYSQGRCIPKVETAIKKVIKSRLLSEGYSNEELEHHLNRMYIDVDSLVDEFFKEMKDKDLKGDLDGLLWSFMATKVAARAKALIERERPRRKRITELMNTIGYPPQNLHDKATRKERRVVHGQRLELSGKCEHRYVTLNTLSGFSESPKSYILKCEKCGKTIREVIS